MIWCLWSVFEEARNLPGNVDAADKALGDCTHVFLDGAYPEFPSEHRLSRDGTAGFCMDAGIYLAKPLAEPDKRTAGLRYVDCHAAEGDWVVVLDADEELTTFCLPDQEVGVIEFRRDSDGARYPRARIYRHKPHLAFRGRHFTLYDAERMVASLTEPGEMCAAGLHHDASHSAARRQAKDSYYRWLMEQEQAYAR